VILALRTGPGDFNKVLVNHAHIIRLKVAGGQVWYIGEHRQLANLPSARFLKVAQKYSLYTIPTPTEEAYFEAPGVPCWPPEERTVQRLRQYLGK
jgi:hypothetical protein